MPDTEKKERKKRKKLQQTDMLKKFTRSKTFGTRKGKKIHPNLTQLGIRIAK